MSNERADEFLSWRGRLGQPHALPEQGLDNPEAVWQRLNARLRGAGQGAEVVRGEPALRERSSWQGRPNRYAIAAALLLLLAIPAALLYRGTRPGRSIESGLPAGGTGSGGGPVKNIESGLPAGGSRDVSATIKDNVAGTRTVVAGTRTAGAGKSIESGFPAGGYAGGSRDRRVAEGRVMTRPEQRPMAVVTTPPATTPTTLSDSGARLAVLTVPVRKAWRVVSINEIDHPGTTSPAVTAQWPATRFRITLNPRSNALPPESALQKKRSTLLKIKLTP
jgi:hypothetical protein